MMEIFALVATVSLGIGAFALLACAIAIEKGQRHLADIRDSFDDVRELLDTPDNGAAHG